LSSDDDVTGDDDVTDDGVGAVVRGNSGASAEVHGGICEVLLKQGVKVEWKTRVEGRNEGLRVSDTCREEDGPLGEETFPEVLCVVRNEISS